MHECIVCNGIGKVMGTNPNPNAKRTATLIPCSYCEGTGKTKLPVYEQLVILNKHPR